MTRVLALAGGAVATALVATAVSDAGGAIWIGMIAPLLVVCVTWAMTESVYKSRPERLTSMMINAFIAKVVFFGAYVAVAIGVLDVRPVPFVASFVSYFIALHLIEALWLKRLFAS